MQLVLLGLVAPSSCSTRQRPPPARTDPCHQSAASPQHRTQTPPPAPRKPAGRPLSQPRGRAVARCWRSARGTPRSRFRGTARRPVRLREGRSRSKAAAARPPGAPCAPITQGSGVRRCRKRRLRVAAARQLGPVSRAALCAPSGLGDFELEVVGRRRLALLRALHPIIRLSKTCLLYTSPSPRDRG